MLLHQNRDISLLSGFKTKATAKYYFEINSLENVFDLSKIYHFAKENNLAILFIWKWTNLLFAFDEYPWIVIANNYKAGEFDERDNLFPSFGEAFGKHPIALLKCRMGLKC